jgi:hypothetical protein
MLQFNYFYIGDRLTLYDLTETHIHGQRHTVASLSENPHIHFHALRVPQAVEALKRYLQRTTFPDAPITWAPLSPAINHS